MHRFGAAMAVLYALVVPCNDAWAWERTQTCVVDGGEGFACRDGELPMPVAWPATCVPWHLNLTGSESIADADTDAA